MAGKFFSDRSRSEGRRVQRVVSDDENAARFSRRAGVRYVALLKPAPAAASCRTPWRRQAAALLIAFALAPFALADSGVWGERGIVRHFAVRAPLLFEADGRGVSVYDISTNDPRAMGVVPTADESLDLALGDDLYVVTRGEIARFAFAGNGALALRASVPTSDY